jgi:tryptophan synthase alpha chain
MRDIDNVFQRLKVQGDSALIGYVTAGDPELEFTPRIAEALVKGGVDILELGVPFSDPIADGPTIQAASVRALQAGTTLKIVLDMAGEIKRKLGVPVVLLTYFNPVFRMGVENFFRWCPTFQLKRQNGTAKPPRAAGWTRFFLRPLPP